MSFANNHSDDGVQSYLKAINKYKVLTKEEEKALFEEYKRTHSQKVKEKIMKHNLKLVVSVAKTFVPMTSSMTLMDLIMEGNIGMMTAIDRFDPNLEYKFSTYSTWWIKQSITRAISNQDTLIRIPVHASEALNKIKKFISQYTISHNGDIPKEDDIAENLDLTIDQVRFCFEIIKKTSVASLNKKVNESESDDTSELGDFLEDESAEEIFARIENKELRKTMLHLLEQMEWGAAHKDRNINVVVRRFGLDGEEPETLESIAKRFGITRERVRQIEAKFIKKCRNPRYKNIFTEYRLK